MEKVKIEDYLSEANRVSGVELSEKDKQSLHALLHERHFIKFNPLEDGIATFLKILRLNQFNPTPGQQEGVQKVNGKAPLPGRLANAFPKALRKSEQAKREYLSGCARGFIGYLKDNGMAENDSRHLSGRIIAMVYTDWNPRYDDGTTKGLGGERNFVLRRIKHLLGEIKIQK